MVASILLLRSKSEVLALRDSAVRRHPIFIEISTVDTGGEVVTLFRSSIQNRWLATPAATIFPSGESESTELVLGNLRFEFSSVESKDRFAAALQGLRFGASRALSQSELLSSDSDVNLSGNQLGVLRTNFVRADQRNRNDIANRLGGTKKGETFRKHFELFDAFIVKENLIQFQSFDVDPAAAGYLASGVDIIDLAAQAHDEVSADLDNEGEGGRRAARKIKLTAAIPAVDGSIVIDVLGVSGDCIFTTRVVPGQVFTVADLRVALGGRLREVGEPLREVVEREIPYVDDLASTARPVSFSREQAAIWFQQEGGVVTRVSSPVTNGDFYREDNAEIRQTHTLSIFACRSDDPGGVVRYGILIRIGPAGTISFDQRQRGQVTVYSSPFRNQWLATSFGSTFSTDESKQWNESTAFVLGHNPRDSFRYEFTDVMAQNEFARTLHALRFAASHVLSQTELGRAGLVNLSHHQLKVFHLNFVRARALKRNEIKERLQGSSFHSDFELFESYIVNENLIQFWSLDGDAAAVAAAGPLANDVNILDLEGEEGRGVVRKINLTLFLPLWAL